MEEQLLRDIGARLDTLIQIQEDMLGILRRQEEERSQREERAKEATGEFVREREKREKRSW